MAKTFVLDTNVVLHDPEAIFSFDDNIVCIPITVIEEADRFKKGSSETNRNARRLSRHLDKLRQEGDLINGVPINDGRGLLKVVILSGGWHDNMPAELKEDTADNRILAMAQQEAISSGNNMVLVTRDVNMRIKSQVIGVNADDHHASKVREPILSDTPEITVPSDVIDEIYADGVYRDDVHRLTNSYAVLTDGGSKSVLARYTGGSFAKVRCVKDVWGISPRNKEQRFAIDALLDDDIKVVTMTGRAGTGKTLVAIACALQKSMEEKKYTKVLVARPIVPMGRDLGFLPGDVSEKMAPWMQPIFDNIDFLFSGQKIEKGKKDDGSNGKFYKGWQQLVDIGALSVEPLTYIRGRSIPYQFIIIDEAQNLTAHEVKTIITRVGEGSKIVLTGDPAQIDNPYVDARSNGLSYCAERFRGERLAAHINLIKGERSELAELAARLL